MKERPSSRSARVGRTGQLGTPQLTDVRSPRELLAERDRLAFRQALDESEGLQKHERVQGSARGDDQSASPDQAHVVRGDRPHDGLVGSTEKLGDDRELIDVVLAREERRAGDHLGENAAWKRENRAGQR